MTDLLAEDAESSPSEDIEQQTGSAPYMSYKGFQNYLKKFHADGLPDRFDGTYFGNVSGSLVAQVRATLKYFELIDDQRHPTDLLKIIAEAEEADQKVYLREIFDARYADALTLSKSATYGQLADVFRARGLTGATVQKATTFFLGMAQHLGVELSPHFKIGRSSVSNGGSRKRRTNQKPTEQQAPPPPPTPPAQTARTVEEEQKAAYVTMLMGLASKDDTEDSVQSSLLDRIERALGIGPAPASETPPPTGGETQDLP